jgi:signal transduction histidine kinase
MYNTKNELCINGVVLYDKKVTDILKHITKLKQTLSFEEKFWILVNMGKDLIDADRCSIWYYEKKSKDLVAKFAHGGKVLRVKSYDGIVGHCFLTKETIILDDVSKSEYYNKEVEKETGYKIKSMITTPIINSQNEVIGVYQALNKIDKTESFSKDDINMLDLVTLYIAEVLESTLLYQNLEKRVKEEVTKNRNKDKILFEQSKMAALGEMVGNIAHHWRQPLSSITSNASALQIKKEIGILNDDYFEDACNNIIDEAEFLSKVIDEFRDFLEEKNLKNQFNLNDSINSFLSLISASSEKQDIKIITNIPKDLRIQSYQNKLNQCLMNLFNNSCDAFTNYKDTKNIIINGYKEKEKFLYLEFIDNAGGIKEDMINKIFEPYTTTKHQSKGTGMGLYIVYRTIVEIMEGTICVENTKVEILNKSYNGVKFTIKLPLN